MVNDTIKVGAKLPLDWQASETWIELPAKQSLPEYLATMGFDYIEFGIGDLLGSEERDLLKSQCQSCRDAGLDISLHPYLGGRAKIARMESHPECKRAIEHIVNAARYIVDLTANPADVIFHPAEDAFDRTETSYNKRRTELLRTSEHFASHLDATIRTRDSEINVTLEHQVPPAPGENIIRIGDTADELFKVVEDTKLGICWDTGHYLLSVDRHDQPLDPSTSFLKRVQHVHLHDVRSGRDHQPIRKDSAQIKKWIEQLQKTGYSGPITLEYDPEAVRTAGGLQAVAQHSLQILWAWLERE